MMSSRQLIAITLGLVLLCPFLAAAVRGDRRPQPVNISITAHGPVHAGAAPKQVLLDAGQLLVPTDHSQVVLLQVYIRNVIHAL